MAIPVISTQSTAVNATTSTLLAEISSLANIAYRLHVALGASTVGSFQIEQVLSTGLGDTALQTDGGIGHLGRMTVYTPADQTAEYVLHFKAETADRIRVRPAAAFAGGEEASAKISLEPL